jgi:hypothetical protein
MDESEQADALQVEGQKTRRLVAATGKLHLFS